MTRDSFPRQKARTRSFTLGAPRSFRVADDGSRVAFIRSKAGDDPRGCLWVFDLATGEERCVVDPAALTGEERLTQEERDRRERMRERLTGVTTYDTDPSLTMAAFVLDGQVYVADLVDGNVQALVGCVEGAFDARLDPTGRRLAYVAGSALYVQELEDRRPSRDRPRGRHRGELGTRGVRGGRGAGTEPRVLVVAGRGACRGCAGRRAARHDVAHRIARRSIGAARAVRYPQAGTDNAEVSLSILGLDGSRVDVDWDREAFEYLVEVRWSERCPLTLLVLSRDQKRWHVLEVDPDSGKTRSCARTRRSIGSRSSRGCPTG